MKRDQAGDTRPPKAMRDHSAFSSGGGDSGWFRLSIGRSKNADPKWLLPVICRLGGVTRDDIGAIRVFDDETRVEIAAKAIEGFAASIIGKSEKGVTIEPSSAPQARDFNAAKKAFRAKPPFKRRTDAESAEFKPWANKGSDGENAPAEKKPWAGKPRAEKPWTPKPEGAGKKSWAGKSAARPAEDRPRKPRPDGAPGKHKAPWQAKPYAGKSPKAKKPRG